MRPAPLKAPIYWLKVIKEQTKPRNKINENCRLGFIDSAHYNISHVP